MWPTFTRLLAYVYCLSLNVLTWSLGEKFLWYVTKKSQFHCLLFPNMVAGLSEMNKTKVLACGTVSNKWEAKKEQVHYSTASLLCLATNWACWLFQALILTLWNYHRIRLSPMDCRLASKFLSMALDGPISIFSASSNLIVRCVIIFELILAMTTLSFLCLCVLCI